MRHPAFFSFLKWAAPSLLGTLAVAIGLLLTAATIWDGVKGWTEAWYRRLYPIMTAGWFLTIVVVAIVAYVAALVYCGRPSSRASRENDLVRSWLKLSSEILNFTADLRINDDHGFGRGEDFENATRRMQQRSASARATYLRRFSAPVTDAISEMVKMGLIPGGDQDRHGHGTNPLSMELDGTTIGKIARCHARKLGLNPDDLGA